MCRAGRVLVKHSRIQEFDPQHGIKLSTVLHACEPNTLWMESGSEDKGHPGLHIDFEARPGYMRSGLKKKLKKKIHSLVHLAYQDPHISIHFAT